MAYHIQSGFGAGELDPALHERTTFDKYKAGLKTLRNAYIGKTGRIISRPGTKYWKATRTPTASAGTFVRDSTAICTKAGHGFGSGTLVRVSSTGTLPGGLSAGVDYYVFDRGHPDQFGLSTSLANATAGTWISLSSAGTGTHTITPTNVGNKKCILYSPPYSPYVIEWGERYVLIHNTSTGTTSDVKGHDMIESDLPYVQFVPSGLYVYVFCKGKHAKKMVLGDLVPSNELLSTRFSRRGTGGTDYDSLVGNPSYPVLTTYSSTGTGYDVNYAVSLVTNGEEGRAEPTGVNFSLPVSGIESNHLSVGTSNESTATEMRVYRRPKSGKAYGFMGSTVVVGGGSDTVFDVYASDADYAHTPCSAADDILNFQFTGAAAYGVAGPRGRTGCVYQQRLIVVDAVEDEIILCSRTGYHRNFLRDHPYSDDSALVFKASASNKSTVLRLMDAPNGLLVFTTTGVYQSTGALTPSNLALEKKGSWVIDETIPPLEIPGGVLFVDRTSNSIRVLITSQEAIGFSGEDIGIFSSHLFLNKTVKSWAFQEGDVPLIWIVMSDGTVNALSYQKEQQMQSWTHHDFDGGLIEHVTTLKSLSAKSVVYFVVNRSGTRYIEYLADRFVANQKDQICLDAAVTFKIDIALNSAATVVATIATDWEGLLTLTSDVAIFANTAGNGAVGTIFRFFDSEGSAVDLTVTTYTSTTVVVVQPSVLFPSAEATFTNLYKTYTTLTGLSHLNGKSVSLLVDGYVEGSPNNDIEDYPVLTPSGGSLTIPNSRRGAIVQVGLPYTCDVEPLDVDTVEQKPTLLESQLVHKVYLKVYNSRGLYVGSKFPKNNKVEGLTDPEERTEDIELGNIGNAAQALTTKRLDIVIPNDWKSSGRVCIRQVDPLPFEILSIIPDMSILT